MGVKQKFENKSFRRWYRRGEVKFDVANIVIIHLTLQKLAKDSNIRSDRKVV